MIFRDRKEAAEKLAEKISLKGLIDPLVVGLPRGGVPIAAEIARKLHASMDILIVRKLGFPENPEFGFGAITEGDFFLLNEDILARHPLTEEQLDDILKEEKEELHRRVEKFRDSRPFPSVQGRSVIVADDGLATGITAAAACAYLKHEGAQEIFIAAPVCSSSAAEYLQSQGAEVVCLSTPEPFSGVGQWYTSFPQLSDVEVLDLLTGAEPRFQKSKSILHIIEESAQPLSNSLDLDRLIEHVKNSQIVMLGEASHGTHEYYKWRTIISHELLDKHGFQFIAVEGDWPPSHEVNRYIQGEAKGTANDALMHFKRWPTWMWGNREVLDLISWMKAKNRITTSTRKIGFYGLDVYSLFESIDEVLKHVAGIDPELEYKLKKSYECFEPFNRDEKRYVRSLIHFPDGCEKSVMSALDELLKTRIELIAAHKDNFFDALQNARIIKNAEDYYRSMVSMDDQSWNIRDRHMLETLEVLLKYYGPNAKGIVWAHNTHIGDHRATSMLSHGQVNIGGLAREHFGSQKVSLVGFSGYQGSVIASSAWGGATRVMKVPPAPPDSYEGIFHQAALMMGVNNYYLTFDRKASEGPLSLRRGHRAIGVVYDPYHERGNYVPTELSKRYDAFIYFDQTKALHPLNFQPEAHEMPETYPFGI